MTPGERTGLIIGGSAVALGSAAFLYYDYQKSKSAGSSSNQVSLQVVGYQSFVAGTGAVLTTSSVGSYATVQYGETVEGLVKVTNLLSSALNVGVRAWVLQGGYSIPGATLVAPMVTGTVEGHLFPQTQPTASSPQTGVSSIAASGSETLAFYSAPVTGGIAAPAASLSRVGILWAAGPAAAVQALPSTSGTLPTNQGIAYVWQPSAIRATFNLVTGGAGAVKVVA